MRYVPRQWPIHAECQATAVRCHHGAFGDARRSHAVVKASEFFDRTSWRICLSKLRLATSGLNLPFRSRNDFRRRSLPAPRPPSSLPSSDQIVCSDPPCSVDCLRHRRAGLSLFQHTRDLPVGVPRLLYLQPLLVDRHKGRKINLHQRKDREDVS